MFKVYFTRKSVVLSTVVESLDEALRTADCAENITLINHTTRWHTGGYTPEVLKTAITRFCADFAPDAWPGARFEHLAS